MGLFRYLGDLNLLILGLLGYYSTSPWCWIKLEAQDLFVSSLGT